MFFILKKNSLSLKIKNSLGLYQIMIKINMDLKKITKLVLCVML